MRNLLSLFAFFLTMLTSGQETTDAAEGPFDQIIIRGATLINGNGAPPIGPVDIVIEKDKITDIEVVGSPDVEINELKRPKSSKKTKRAKKS